MKVWIGHPLSQGAIPARASFAKHKSRRWLTESPRWRSVRFHQRILQRTSTPCSVLYWRPRWFQNPWKSRFHRCQHPELPNCYWPAPPVLFRLLMRRHCSNHLSAVWWASNSRPNLWRYKRCRQNNCTPAIDFHRRMKQRSTNWPWEHWWLVSKSRRNWSRCKDGRSLGRLRRQSIYSRPRSRRYSRDSSRPAHWFGESNPRPHWLTCKPPAHLPSPQSVWFHPLTTPPNSIPLRPVKCLPLPKSLQNLWKCKPIRIWRAVRTLRSIYFHPLMRRRLPNQSS